MCWCEGLAKERVNKQYTIHITSERGADPALCLYSAFPVILTIQDSLHPFTHINLEGTLTHTHSHSDDTLGTVGIQYLAQGYSACRLEEQRIKSLTFRLMDNPFYLLRHSCPSSPRCQVVPGDVRRTCRATGWTTIAGKLMANILSSH